MKLEVRRPAVGMNAHKCTRLVNADGHRSATYEQVLYAHLELAQPASHVVVCCDRLGTPVDHADLQVILQILTHARKVMHHGDAMLAQQIGRAHAR